MEHHGDYSLSSGVFKVTWVVIVVMNLLTRLISLDHLEGRALDQWKKLVLHTVCLVESPMSYLLLIILLMQHHN